MTGMLILVVTKARLGKMKDKDSELIWEAYPGSVDDLQQGWDEQERDDRESQPTSQAQQVRDQFPDVDPSRFDFDAMPDEQVADYFRALYLEEPETMNQLISKSNAIKQWIHNPK